MEQTNELHTNAEKINGNKPDFSTKPIDGTPFTIIKTEKGHALIMGNNLMSPWFDEETECLDYTILNHWTLVASMIEVYIGHRKLNNETL